MINNKVECEKCGNKFYVLNHFKEELQETQAKLKSCEAERDKLRDIYGIAACEFQKLDKDFHTLGKIAREGLILGLKTLDTEDAPVSAGQDIFEEALKKIDKLLK